MSKYVLVDFRQLVGAWYNEFLPAISGKRAGFIESVGLVYLNSINLDPHLKDSAQFFLKKVAEMGEGRKIVVQEPRPVNNPRVQAVLKVVDKTQGVSPDNKLKLLHMSNRRYVPMSASVLVSQDKDIDLFLDKVFKLLEKLDIDEAKFHKSGSLGMADVVETARAFFPRKKLEVLEVAPTFPISVQSTNEIIMGLGQKLKCGFTSQDADRYIGKSKENLTKEFVAML